MKPSLFLLSTVLVSSLVITSCSGGGGGGSGLGGITGTNSSENNGESDGAKAAREQISPEDVLVDDAGNIYSTEILPGRVKKKTPEGVVTVLGFTSLAAPHGLTIDNEGAIYVADTSNDLVKKLTASGVESVVPFSSVRSPDDVAVDSDGVVYVLDDEGIKKITKGGVESTVVLEEVDQPEAMTIDKEDNLYVAGKGSAIVKVNKLGAETLIPLEPSIGRAKGVAVDSVGNVFVTDYDKRNTRKVTIDGVNSTLPLPYMSDIHGVAVDSNDNVYVGGGEVIHKITPAGVKSVPWR